MAKPHDSAIPESLDRALALAAGNVRLLFAVSPENTAEQSAALLQALERGTSYHPNYRYRNEANPRLGELLQVGIQLCEKLQDDELAQAYLERFEELRLEQALCDSVGTRTFAPLARQRFQEQRKISENLDALVETWLGEPPETPNDVPILSEGGDPSSLLSRMREALGEIRSTFVVRNATGLSALAATGDRVVYIQEGRWLNKTDVERTVLHEIHGHVLPRMRAERERVGLLRCGVARGIDEQEGLALLYEERSGFMSRTRRRELALRHRAVRLMDEGADPLELCRTLAGTYGLPHEDAVRLAQRAFRGGNGLSGGLGRERVYLCAMVRIQAHFKQFPADEALLAGGQRTLASIGLIRRYTNASPEQ